MSDDLAERLRNTPNWMREEYGHYKDGLKVYDRAPFEAADALDAQAAEITRLRAALATAQVEALKKAAEIARQFAQSEGWSGTSALRLRNCIIAEAAIYTKTGGKNE
jgi:hypothetical protein